MTDGKRVRIQDQQSDTTHVELCRYTECIERECPRYERCCGAVDW